MDRLFKIVVEVGGLDGDVDGDVVLFVFVVLYVFWGVG